MKGIVEFSVSSLQESAGLQRQLPGELMSPPPVVFRSACTCYPFDLYSCFVLLRSRSCLADRRFCSCDLVSSCVVASMLSMSLRLVSRLSRTPPSSIRTQMHPTPVSPPWSIPNHVVPCSFSARRLLRRGGVAPVGRAVNAEASHVHLHRTAQRGRLRGAGGD